MAKPATGKKPQVRKTATTRKTATKGKTSAKPRKPKTPASAKRKSSPTKRRRSPSMRVTQGRRTRLGGLLAVLLVGSLAALGLSWPESEPSSALRAEAPQTVKAASTPKAPLIEAEAPEPASLPNPPIQVAVAPPPPQAAPPQAAPPQAAPPQAAPPQAAPVTPAPKPDAVPTWQRHAAAYDIKPGQPVIAIVLDDLGHNKPRSRRATDLPGPLTLAYLPYASDLQAQTAEARRRGHEILIHMPMEPQNLAGNNPGENALLTSLSPQEQQRRLRWALDRFEGYVGINNHMGSAYTADRPAMDRVMAELSRDGLLYLDSLTSARSQASQAAQAAGVPNLVRDIFLDHGGDDPGLVLAQLAKVEELALKQGQAVAIGHPHDGTLTALQLWIPDALARGFALVPVSALVEPRRRGAARPG
ncbi:MAG: divergent polysaccharide deacetylase family protein [Pseudomonadota bacterium]